MFGLEVQKPKEKEIRRGSDALTPEERKRAITELEQSFKGRDWSDVLSEILGRKDLEIGSYRHGVIGVSKSFEVTKEEAIEDELKKKRTAQWNIQQYSQPGPHTHWVYHDGNRFEEEMTEAEVQKEIKRLGCYLESIDKKIERIREGKEKIHKKEFTVSEFSMKEILGERDTEAIKIIGRKAQDLGERFRKLFFKYQDIHHKRQEKTDFSRFVSDMKLDHYLGLLDRVWDRSREEPLFDTSRFLRAQLQAVAGKRHETALVEKFDPRQVEELYQSYLKKYQEYEEALKPFDDVEERKPSQGPYR